MNLIKSCTLCTFLFLAPLAHAAKSPAQMVKETFSLYKKGSYPQAIEALKPLERIPSKRALAYYWKGLCYSKLQDYESANKAFGKASSYKVDAEDFHYEFGQSL